MRVLLSREEQDVVVGSNKLNTALYRHLFERERDEGDREREKERESL